MHTVGRFVAAQVVILLLGTGLIWASAGPLAADGSALDSIDWAWLVRHAVFWGLIAGGAEGLALGRDRVVGAIVIATLVAPVALWVPLLFVSDHLPGGTVIRTDPAELVAALSGWGVYGALSVLVAAVVAVAVIIVWLARPS